MEFLNINVNINIKINLVPGCFSLDYDTINDKLQQSKHEQKLPFNVNTTVVFQFTLFANSWINLRS